MSFGRSPRLSYANSQGEMEVTANCWWVHKDVAVKTTRRENIWLQPENHQEPANQSGRKYNIDNDRAWRKGFNKSYWFSCSARCEMEHISADRNSIVPSHLSFPAAFVVHHLTRTWIKSRLEFTNVYDASLEPLWWSPLFRLKQNKAPQAWSRSVERKYRILRQRWHLCWHSDFDRYGSFAFFSQPPHQI